MTLKQRVMLSEHVLRVRKRVSMGNGFIPAGSTEAMQREASDETALLELVQDAHPEIIELNAQHEQLLHEIHTAPEGTDVTSLQNRCAELARAIVSIEYSLGLEA